MFMFRKKLEMPTAGDALPGRPNPIPTAENHFVLARPLKGPYPVGYETAIFGLGCFWGAERAFLKLGDGSLYVAPVWPGPSVFPEFTSARSRAWWGSLYKDFVADGIAGFWNDMDEPAIFETTTKTMPLTVRHRIDSDDFAPRTAGHYEIHNVYGMQNSRATHDGVLSLRPNVRPFVMTRASYAGGQRYAVTWTGDNSSSWDHLKLAVQQMLSGARFNSALIILFVGAISAAIAVGRTIKPAEDPASAPAAAD